MRRIFVTGAMGYVGSALVPVLLENGFEVVAYDLGLYGDTLPDHKCLTKVIGDIRNLRLLGESIRGCTDVIHLACISNDPSFELDRSLGREINFDAFEPLVKCARDNGITRFIYASSSSVYGVKSLENVTEDVTLEPLTDYSLFKARCEEILLKYKSKSFTVTTVRPATVCGYAPRQRLDVVVNIFTTQAYFNRLITLHGGQQKRPNINITDMVRCYVALLDADQYLVNGQAFNAGDTNYTLEELSEIVVQCVPDTRVVTEGTSDPRSYHISSEKIFKSIGFVPINGVKNSVDGLLSAFSSGLLVDPLNNEFYYNIKRMKNIGLK